MTTNFHVPQARSWREIPQPVKPRTMSGTGRWRYFFSTVRGIIAVAVLLGLVWGGVKIGAVVQENSRKMPSMAKAVAVSHVAFTTDGVLDDAWVARTLALRAGVALMELDLQKLRGALLTSTQVRTAMVTRNFPSTLVVNITERTPVARLMTQTDNREHPLFVARDGSVFDAVNLDDIMVKTLPWLDGVHLVRRGSSFQPIAGAEAVADLFATAKLQAAALSQGWNIASLARLKSDGEIEVRTSSGQKIVFGVTEDYFRQLARLDLLLDTIAQSRPDQIPAQINLAIGTQVPVSFQETLKVVPPLHGKSAPATVLSAKVSPPGQLTSAHTSPSPSLPTLKLSPPREF